MNESFFVTPESEPCAILLVDASYSVKSPSAYSLDANTTIFEEIQKICSNLPHKNFRLLFWNSDNENNRFGLPVNGVGGIKGVLKFSEQVEKEELSQKFKIAAMNIQPCCVTDPQLAFRNIDDWLEKGYSQTIYFLTDGLMGWSGIQPGETQLLQRQLAESIGSIIKRFKRVQITIIAVERNLLNVNVEQSQMIGNDVFTGIARNNMTNALCKYVSYAPNKTDGYVHINKLQTVPGFVPFGERSFSILSTSQFMQYLSALIESHAKDEDQLLRIIQDLTVTLNVLTKERPPKMREQTLAVFIRMFGGTVISESTATFILSQGVAAEACGSAQLYSEYRSNLKKLFADASRLLLNGVANALEISKESLTLPLRAGNKRIIVVSNSTVAKESLLEHKSAAYIYGGSIVPMLPFIGRDANLMTKQCLRQWLRALLSKEFHLHTTSDEIIFVAMCLNLQAQLALANDLSPTAARVRAAYVNMITVLLEKKRLNSQSTEIETLLAGNLFIPNDGNVKMFEKYLCNARKQLGLADSVQPLLVWYALCVAHSTELAKSQWRHCEQYLGNRSVLQDFADWNLTEVSIFQIPDQLEYECPITLESTNISGGMKILPHAVPGSKTSICQSPYVFSLEGFKKLFDGKETCQCLICYANLKKEDFANTEPQGVENKETLSTLETKAIFSARPESSSSSSAPAWASAVPTTVTSTACPGRLVVLIGTVGCGKSRLAKQMKEIAERENRHCIVEGTDKYCMQGLSMPNALNAVKSAIVNACNLQAKDKTIILDVCNERFNAADVFGVNLSSWNIQKIYVNLDRKMLRQYLAWSLCNVLRRGENDSFLNPPKSSVATCIKIHLRKAKNLFGQNTQELVSENTTLQKALSILEKDANAYQMMLDHNADKFNAVF